MNTSKKVKQNEPSEESKIPKNVMVNFLNSKQELLATM